jgi:hypothetical protein
MRNIYKILVGKLEGKRPLDRSRRRWENNISVEVCTGVAEIGWVGINFKIKCQWRAL